MTLVEIPFNAWSRKRLTEGVKTATSRTKLYGNPGDTFKEGGVEYTITAIYYFPTDYIIYNFFQEEGAKNPQELRRVLNGIFRGNPLPKHQWLHRFKPKNTGRRWIDG